MNISAEEKNRYLRETEIVLAREGFRTDRTDTGKLRVLLDGTPLCEVTENGGITYRNEDIRLAIPDESKALSWHHLTWHPIPVCRREGQVRGKQSWKP